MAQTVFNDHHGYVWGVSHVSQAANPLTPIVRVLLYHNLTEGGGDLPYHVGTRTRPAVSIKVAILAVGLNTAVGVHVDWVHYVPPPTSQIVEHVPIALKQVHLERHRRRNNVCLVGVLHYLELSGVGWVKV